MNSEVQQWLVKALEDYRVAQHELVLPETDVVTTAVCFHCQQFVEEDEERADPEIQQLLAQERRYSTPGVYYKAVRERNAELVRPIVRASAELHAAILRKYGRAVLERARKSSA
jgi:hypothetical protein